MEPKLLFIYLSLSAGESSHFFRQETLLSQMQSPVNFIPLHRTHRRKFLCLTKIIDAAVQAHVFLTAFSLPLLISVKTQGSEALAMCQSSLCRAPNYIRKRQDMAWFDFGLFFT